MKKTIASFIALSAFVPALWANPLSHPGVGLNVPGAEILRKNHLWGAYFCRVPNTSFEPLESFENGLSAGIGLFGFAQVAGSIFNSAYAGTQGTFEAQVNPFPAGIPGMGGFQVAGGVRNISNQRQVGTLNGPYQSTDTENRGDINSNSPYVVASDKFGSLIRVSLGWGWNEFFGYGRTSIKLYGLFGQAGIRVGPGWLIGEMDGRALNLGASFERRRLGLKAGWFGVENVINMKAREAGMRSSLGLQLSFSQ